MIIILSLCVMVTVNPIEGTAVPFVCLTSLALQLQIFCNSVDSILLRKTTLCKLHVFLLYDTSGLPLTWFTLNCETNPVWRSCCHGINGNTPFIPFGTKKIRARRFWIILMTPTRRYVWIATFNLIVPNPVQFRKMSMRTWQKKVRHRQRRDVLLVAVEVSFLFMSHWSSNDFLDKVSKTFIIDTMNIVPDWTELKIFAGLCSPR